MVGKTVNMIFKVPIKELKDAYKVFSIASFSSEEEIIVLIRKDKICLYYHNVFEELQYFINFPNESIYFFKISLFYLSAILKAPVKELTFKVKEKESIFLLLQNDYEYNISNKISFDIYSNNYVYNKFSDKVVVDNGFYDQIKIINDIIKILKIQQNDYIYFSEDKIKGIFSNYLLIIEPKFNSTIFDNTIILYKNIVLLSYLLNKDDTLLLENHNAMTFIGSNNFFLKFQKNKIPKKDIQSMNMVTNQIFKNPFILNFKDIKNIYKNLLFISKDISILSQVIIDKIDNEFCLIIKDLIPEYNHSNHIHFGIYNK